MTSAKRYTAPKPSLAQKRFLDALGGNAKVAEAVSARLLMDKPLTPQAVAQWKVRGIPYGYRDTLLAVAEDKGVEAPADMGGMRGAA